MTTRTLTIQTLTPQPATKRRLAGLIAILVFILAMGDASYAKDFVADGGPNVIKGTSKNDYLNGGVGNDLILGGSGRDRIIGGLGNDRILGGPGRDRIFAADGGPDFVDCGAGRDIVHADKSDTLKNCEQVIYVTIVVPPAPTPTPPTPVPTPPIPAAPPVSPYGYADPIHGVLSLGAGNYASVDAAYQAYVWTWQKFAIPWLDYYWGNLIGQDRYFGGLNHAYPVAATDIVNCTSLGGSYLGLTAENAMYCAPPDVSQQQHGVYSEAFHDGNQASDFVTWDDAYLFQIFLEQGDFAFVGALAHEWGHAVQARLGWVPFAKTPPSVELNADCLMGVFERYLVDQNLVDPTLLANQVGSLLVKVADRAPGDNHGTFDQRAGAANYGYAYGADNCRNYLY